MSATDFKARCLEFGTSITITKHGKPVAQLVPLHGGQPRLYASLPVTIVAEIIGPIDESWEAER